MRSAPDFSLSRIQRLRKEFTWVVVGNTAGVVGALCGIRILTELLDPVVYGQLALGLTLAAFVNQVVMGPLSNGATRFYAPAIETHHLGSYLAVLRRFVLFASGVIVVLTMLLTGGLLIVGRSEWIAITIAALVFSLVSGYGSVLNGIQNAARQRAIVALHQGVEPWARFFVAAVLMVWIRNTSTVAMSGYATAVIFVLVSQYMFFCRNIAPQHTIDGVVEKGWSKQIWSFSWPFSVFGVFTWIQVASERWTLELFATTRDVGLYALLLQFGQYPMSLLMGMAVQFATPIFYRLAGDASDDGRNADVTALSWRLIVIVLAITVAAFIGALLLHEELFQIFVANDYRTVSYLLPWMILSGGVFAAGQSVALNMMSQMRTRAMISAKVTTAVFGVAINIILVYWYGLTGIVVATLLFSMMYFLWMLLLANGREAGFKGT